MKTQLHVTSSLILITLFTRVLATPTKTLQGNRVERDLAKGGATSKTGKYGQQTINEDFLQYSVDDDDDGYQIEQGYVDEKDGLVDEAEPIDQQTNYQQNQHTGNYGVKPAEPSYPQSPIEPEKEQEQVTEDEDEDEECPDDLPTYRRLGNEKCGLLVDGELGEQVVNPEEQVEETNPNQYPTQQQLPDYVSQTQDGSYGFQGPHSNWGQIPRLDEEVEQETVDEKYDKYEEELQQQHHVDEPEKYEEEQQHQVDEPEKYDEQQQQQHVDEPEEEEEEEEGDMEGYQQHVNPNPATYSPGSSGSISGPHFGQHIVPSAPNYESPDDGSYDAGSESQWSQSQINTGTGNSGVNDRYPYGGGYSRPYRPIRYGSNGRGNVDTGFNRGKQDDGGRSAGYRRDDLDFNGVILNPEYSDYQGEGDFTCFQKSAGYFVDYDSDCRRFYRCAEGHFQAYEFECGPGTKFNILNEQCEYAKDVYCHPFKDNRHGKFFKN